MNHLVGIAGGSGSGKTLLAEMLGKLFLDKSIVIAQDYYYFDLGLCPPEEKRKINFDHPDAIEKELLVKHLDQLCAGKKVDVPRYDFLTGRRTHTVPTQSDHGVIILEGLFVLHWSEVRDRMAASVFVDTNQELRIERRVKRDQQIRKKPQDVIEEALSRDVLPMHEKFVAPSRSHAKHLVVNDTGNPTTLEADALKIAKHLKTSLFQ